MNYYLLDLFKEDLAKEIPQERLEQKLQQFYKNDDNGLKKTKMEILNFKRAGYISEDMRNGKFYYRPTIKLLQLIEGISKNNINKPSNFDNNKNYHGKY